MDLDTAVEFAGTRPRGVLTTIRNNNLPQQSIVTYKPGADGLFRISITATRAKYKNLVKRPWAALFVSSEDEWQYVVLEGEVTLSEVATNPHDDVVEELVAYYRDAMGEHPDWDEYRATMVRDQRLVARLRPNRAYGMLPEPG